MAKSPKDPSQKWLEVLIKAPVKGKTTTEIVEMTAKLLFRSADVTRISEHPSVMNRSLMQLQDGSNFVVDTPYDSLKEIVLEHV